MSDNSLSILLTERFGLDLYQKACNYPNNKISIISLAENPIKIRALILDNEREFHIIINQKKAEIYHDCPSFLIHSKKKDKICVHVIKLLLMVKDSLSMTILNDFEDYKFTSEDFGSKKKSKNYLKLANRCFDTANSIEGLSYLNKAMINQSKCNLIIAKYLDLAISNNLYIEFFEFLKQGYEKDLKEYFFEYEDKIEQGFIKFLDSISIYSFFNLLIIINSIDFIFQFKDMAFLSHLIEKFNFLVNSSDFNQRYFSIYFIEKQKEDLEKINRDFKEIISKKQLELLKNESIQYFMSEIDNFCIIDKLKLMKKQFKEISIPKENYLEKYKLYKYEIRELEKKVYLKKFAYLLLLMEKYNVIKDKGDFIKKRNTYIVNHNDENMQNPVYNYIIERIGFYGPKDQNIKSSDIGLNFFLMTKLFLDDFNAFPDVLYYKNQYWGENETHEIDTIKGYSLLSKKIDYSYDIYNKYSNINDVNIVEWDLASRPLQGSLVNAYGSQIIIPDQNNPLFHDLKPFDLCYCVKNPTKIEGNLIKKINIITKCSFKDAIISVSKGMEYIEGFYPLSLVRSVLNKDINPFEAHEYVINNPKQLFIPNYSQFIKEFKKFLFQFIKREKNYIFGEFKKESMKKVNQIIFLLDLKYELDGMVLPYSKIMDKLFEQDIEFGKFKKKFLEETHIYIQNLLEKAENGSTIVFNLKKMQFTQFSKYSLKIIGLRKEEFESKKILKNPENYDISELYQTYYGKKFTRILNLEEKKIVRPDIFNKIKDFSKKLKLRLNIINSNS